MQVNTNRLIQVRTYDDGVDAWRATRIASSSDLQKDIYGYCDYFERTGSFATRRELPHAEGVLIVNLGEAITITGGDGGVLRLEAGEAFVAGAHLRPALSSSAGTQAGIHVFLALETLRRLLGVPMDRLIDRVTPLGALLGKYALELGQKLGEAKDLAGRVELLDAALASRLAEARPLGRQQQHALRLLRARPDQDIADIARDLGWSRKHLTTRVQDAVGVGPRSFRRLFRFQKLTAMIARDADPMDWAGLAGEAGYCDQSHMIREFREFSGLTPRQYLARTLPNGGGVVEA